MCPWPQQRWEHLGRTIRISQVAHISEGREGPRARVRPQGRAGHGPAKTRRGESPPRSCPSKLRGPRKRPAPAPHPNALVSAPSTVTSWDRWGERALDSSPCGRARPSPRGPKPAAGADVGAELPRSQRPWWTKSKAAGGPSASAQPGRRPRPRPPPSRTNPQGRFGRLLHRLREEADQTQGLVGAEGKAAGRGAQAGRRKRREETGPRRGGGGRRARRSPAERGLRPASAGLRAARRLLSPAGAAPRPRLRTGAHCGLGPGRAGRSAPPGPRRRRNRTTT